MQIRYMTSLVGMNLFITSYRFQKIVTDVKGYRRLTGDNEMAAVETITSYRSFIGKGLFS